MDRLAHGELNVQDQDIEELDANLAELTAAFEKASFEKVRCQDEVNRTNKTIELANRLVRGLESENLRWAQSIAQYREQEETLCGDVLLMAAFISYAGSFSKRYRRELVRSMWMPYLRNQKVPVPMTEDLEVVALLTDDATIATWNNEGLPSDKMSTENATIVSNCERWPLLIDPQLQGMKWIKNRYNSNLKVVNLGQKGYMDVLEQALGVGDTVLIENMEEMIDPVLDPLLGRNTIKKGRDGLEDQILAEVVNFERPDLEQLKSDLTKQQNHFKIELKLLEDELLTWLSAADWNFLGDTLLVKNLETTQDTAAEIETKVRKSQ
ncbi:dynein axonemal heavy chain 17-like [Mobula birostris]|uniref:dynein axonemal heavy chain 17-like n=1 Tax=Mobula birostris TaxID=1983395 RepID=UPI003B27ED3D